MKSRAFMLGCLAPGLLVALAMIATVSNFLGWIPLPWSPLPPAIGETYNIRSAIAAALSVDAAGGDVRDATNEIERLPVFGCARTEALADGRERCTQRFGPYMDKRPLRIRAYSALAQVYLNWDNEEDRFGADARPSRALMARVAQRLEGDPMRTVVAATHVPEALEGASHVPIAAAIYHDLGDNSGFRRSMQRHCGRNSCGFAERLFLDDLDGATRAAEEFDFENGNMGQRGIYTGHRLALLHYLLARGRSELALRMARVLMRDFDGYPVEVSEALTAIFSIAPREQFVAWIEEKDTAARARPGTQSASAAAIAIHGWGLLEESDRVEGLLRHWAPIAANETPGRCTLAGPITRMGEPPREGETPACLQPYKALMGLPVDY